MSEEDTYIIIPSSYVLSKSCIISIISCLGDKTLVKMRQEIVSRLRLIYYTSTRSRDNKFNINIQLYSRERHLQAYQLLMVAQFQGKPARIIK